MKNLLFISTLALLTVFAACKKDSDEKDCITGNGNIAQESRTVPAYDAVNADGAFNIFYSQLNASQVDLFCDSNLLPIISTVVTNEQLFIDTDDDKCYTTENNIEVYLSSPVVSHFVLNGAGTVTANNVVQPLLAFETNGSFIISASMTVDQLNTLINGSGDANFSGAAKKAEFLINGAGSIFASTLNTLECKVVISGAGDVRVKVSETLDVTISGTGNVYYTGEPENITTNITGTGKLIKEG